MIIVKPTAGLCNRMRVINSAIQLAKVNQQPQIMLNWQKDDLLKAEFNELFQPIKMVLPIENDSLILQYFLNYRDLTDASYKARLKKQLLTLFFFGYKYYDDVKIKDLRFDDQFWEKNHNRVVLNTCYDFYEYRQGTNYYHLFKPIPEIENRIQKEVVRFNQAPSVGIHIRRTDNLVSIQNSGTDLFVKRVEAMLQINDQTRFYLATDDPSTEDMFVSYFGNKILCQAEKDLNRNSKRGIEDAVVDLYALSRTEYLLGSYWSSFSAVASWINKIPLEIVK